MTPLEFFLAHRVAVFPIATGAKTPAVAKGTHWADWDDFLRARPTSAYGVVLGSLVVVDTDQPATSEWANAHVPPTPFMVLSGPYHSGGMGRGVHRYYRVPPASSWPPYIRRDGLNIEFRRAGQYVLGPASPHPSGLTYDAAPWSWAWDDIPCFPSDFVFEDGSVGVSRVGAAYAEPTAPVTESNRTAELFRYVRHLKANEVDRDLAWTATQFFNTRFCHPPKSDRWLASWFGRAWGHRDRPDFKQCVFEDTSAFAVVRDDHDDLEVIHVEGAL